MEFVGILGRAVGALKALMQLYGRGLKMAIKIVQLYQRSRFIFNEQGSLPRASGRSLYVALHYLGQSVL